MYIRDVVRFRYMADGSILRYLISAEVWWVGLTKSARLREREREKERMRKEGACLMGSSENFRGLLVSFVECSLSGEEVS